MRKAIPFVMLVFFCASVNVRASTGIVESETIQSFMQSEVATKELKDTLAHFEVVDYYNLGIQNEAHLIEGVTSELAMTDAQEHYRYVAAITDANVADLKGLLERRSDAGGLTLFLTGGLYSDCIFKSFCIAIDYALFEKGVPLHIVLPEAGIEEAQDASVREFYLAHLRGLHVKKKVFIDGAEHERLTDYGGDEPYSLAVSFYGPKVSLKSEEIVGHLDAMSRELKPYAYGWEARIAEVYGISEDDILLVPRVIEEVLTDYESLDRESFGHQSSYRVSEPHIRLCVRDLLNRYQHCRGDGVAGLRNDVTTMVHALNDYAVDDSRRPSELVWWMYTFATNRSVRRRVNSYEELAAAWDALSEVVVRSPEERHNYLYLQNLVHFLSSPDILRLIESHDDLLALIASIGSSEYEYALVCEDEFSERMFSYLRDGDIETLDELIGFLRVTKASLDVHAESDIVEHQNSVCAFFTAAKAVSFLGDAKKIIAVMDALNTFVLKLGFEESEITQVYDRAAEIVQSPLIDFCADANSVIALIEGLYVVTDGTGSSQDLVVSALVDYSKANDADAYTALLNEGLARFRGKRDLSQLDDPEAVLMRVRALIHASSEITIFRSA